MRYIRWCPLDLKLVKSFDLFSEKTWFLCKDNCFRHKMWLRVLSYSIYKNWNIVTCFFISIRLISIFSMKSVEERTSHTCQSRNWLFPSFFLSEILVFGTNKACNRKICICSYNITNTIVLSSSQWKVVLEDRCF